MLTQRRLRRVASTVLLTLVLLIGSADFVLGQVREEWVARYDGPSNRFDFARAVAVDAEGNVYVGGSSCGVGAADGRCLDYVTLKYDTAGRQLWERRYDGPANVEDDLYGMALDADGNVYVTGKSCGRADFLGVCQDMDYATLKYDADGNLRWVRRYDGPAQRDDGAWAIALDAQSHVYVTGSACAEARKLCYNTDYATLKYDSEGNLLWIVSYDGPGNGPDGARAIVVDAGGNAIVTGASWRAGSATDYATVKYDPEGKQLWVARYDGTAHLGAQAIALAVDAAGNAYVTGTICVRFGQFVRACTDFDYATLKYDADGNQLWVARYDHPEEFDHDHATALALDARGNIYVTGWSVVTGFVIIWGSDKITREDYATVKYDSQGNELWVHRYNGPQSLPDLPAAITTDAAGNAYVTGWSCTREDPIGRCLVAQYATIKYDPEGTLLWLARHPSPEQGYDTGRDLFVDAGGNVYVTGTSGDFTTDVDLVTIKYIQKK